jgi:hypothetical protein
MRMLPVALGGRRPLRRSLKNSSALSVAWLFMSEYLEKEESVYFLLKYQTTQQMAWRVKEDIDQHKKSFGLSNNFSSFDTYTLSLSACHRGDMQAGWCRETRTYPFFLNSLELLLIAF